MKEIFYGKYDLYTLLWQQYVEIKYVFVAAEVKLLQKLNPCISIIIEWQGTVVLLSIL